MTAHRTALASVLLLLSAAAADVAAAGTLYRCKGPAGETAYTSTRAGFTDCSAVSEVSMYDFASSMFLLY